MYMTCDLGRQTIKDAYTNIDSNNGKSISSPTLLSHP
jgi:hypothetical protein